MGQATQSAGLTRTIYLVRIGNWAQIERCILYIMRRTQLYLEDDLWAALHTRALLEKATVSELVRVAARERYMGNQEDRRAAMLGIVGLWKDRVGMVDTEELIRDLRNDNRLDRLDAQ